MKAKISFIIARQTVFSLIVIGVSLPLLQAVHLKLNLPAAPSGALFVLGSTVLLAFVGAGLIGAFVSNVQGRPFVAAIGALIWSSLLLSLALPLYASSIADALTREGAALAWNERENLWARGQETLQQARNGDAREAARAIAQKTGAEALEKSKTLARSGAARLPALALLLWMVFVPPLIAAVECRLAARRRW